MFMLFDVRTVQVLADVLRNITGSLFLVPNLGQRNVTKPCGIIWQVPITVTVANNGIFSHAMEQTVHVPCPVLVLFGDKNVTKLDPEFLVVVPYPHTEVTDKAVNVVTVLLILVEGQSNEPLPIITESQFPNTGTCPANVGSEFLIGDFPLIVKGIGTTVYNVTEVVNNLVR